MISQENPFAYIAQSRATRVEQVRAEIENRKLLVEEQLLEELRIEQARKQRREPHIERVDAMVRDTLAALVEAAYPSKSEGASGTYEGSVKKDFSVWKIQYISGELMSGWDGGWRDETKTALSVALIFDDRDDAVGFSITRHDREIFTKKKILGLTIYSDWEPFPDVQSGLSEQELVYALKTLYPEG
jgi:hypothetical protein